MLVAPTIAFLTLIIIYPLIKAIQLSFGKDQGLDPATGLFVEGGSAGLSNYTHWLLQKCGDVDCPPGTLGAQFYDALWVTLFFTVVSVVIELLLGMWFAMIMNRDFKGRALVRAAILIPWAIPTAVTAKLWFFIFAYDGIANTLLGFVGISPQLWTSDPWAAKFAIIIADVWKTTPFMALLILAGLQLIPSDVYEAAEIDGASKLQTFVQDHPAAGQGAAHGRRAVPHPRRAAHLRPARHPHPRCRRHDLLVDAGDQADPQRLPQRLGAVDDRVPAHRLHRLPVHQVRWRGRDPEAAGGGEAEEGPGRPGRQPGRRQRHLDGSLR